jgi:hypothetical protein
MRKPFQRIPALLVASLASLACQPSHPTIDPEAVARYLARERAGGLAAGEGAPQSSLAVRLSVTVVSARGLPDLDPGPGDSDPYVVLSVDGQRHRTSTAEGTADPDWGDTFVVTVAPGAALEASVFDADSLSSDERVAVASVPLPALAVGASERLALPLRGGAAGELVLALRGLPREGELP